MKTIKIAGIIADDASFHKTCANLIRKTHEISKCEVLIALLPGYFAQSGVPSITDKWERAASALAYGADLVIEMPFAFCVQSISRYTKAAVDLLALAGVDTIVITSEINNPDELQLIAAMPIHVDAIKVNTDKSDYPSSYKTLAGAYYPHDISAIAYIRAMQEKDMRLLTFQHIDEESNIADEPGAAPAWPDYYPFLRWKLLTNDASSLARLYLFDEGVAHLMIKHATLCDTWQDFLRKCATRRNTEAYIRRVCVHMLTHTLKTEMESGSEVTTLRILGFNDVGRKYLKELTAKGIHIASRFNKIPRSIRELEYHAALAYVSPLQRDRRNAILRREIGGPVIKTKDGT